jgi:hypothetical protein
MMTAPVYDLTITTPSTGFTSKPILLFLWRWSPSNNSAIATCIQVGGANATCIQVGGTNAGASYTNAPKIGWTGRGLVIIPPTITGGPTLTAFTVTAGGSFV